MVSKKSRSRSPTRTADKRRLTLSQNHGAVEPITKAAIILPRINRNRCEGKAACEAACPHAVLEVSRIKPEHFSQLSFLGKLKKLAHGRLTVYVTAPDQCQGCGQCARVCPERAITLTLAQASAKESP